MLQSRPQQLVPDVISPKQHMSSMMSERISYLIDAVRELDAVPREMLNEDMETPSLDAALLDRVAGLDSVQAQAVIDADREEFARWIEDSGCSSPAAYFVLGCVSLLDLGSALVDPPIDTAPRPEVSIDLPDEMNPVRQYGRIDASKGAVSIVVTPGEEISRKFALLGMERFKPLEGMTSSVVDVAFGSVHGKRQVIRDRHSVTIVYVLSVPGGYARVDLMCNRDFDEALVEPYLHTLRIQ